MNYSELFQALAPETALIAGALIVLGFDLTTLRRQSDATRLNAAVIFAALAVVAETSEAEHYYGYYGSAAS